MVEHSHLFFLDITDAVLGRNIFSLASIILAILQHLYNICLLQLQLKCLWVNDCINNQTDFCLFVDAVFA